MDFWGFGAHKAFGCSKTFAEVPHWIVKRNEVATGLEENWLKAKIGCLMLTFQNGRISSRVFHCSRLGPVLFSIFINDMEKEEGREISRFADGTKLCQIVSHCAMEGRSRRTLQNWAKTWQMSFSVGKFKGMYSRKNYLSICR